MKKYAIAGAGHRAWYMYAKPLTTELKDYARLTGIYDVNLLRAKVISEECGNVPVYDNFEVMLTREKPDSVIVTTVDGTHHDYIVKALESGCDVIVEKPMAIDAEKCNIILEAEKKTEKNIIVTFNCRFMPYVVKIKELLKEGLVGDVLNVDFEWMLDTSHGADYFRRWHRYMDKSGGLLVHKATHHFDMVNWWLEDEPDEVFAFGSRRFYGPTRENRGERCLTCRYKSACEFYFDITSRDFLKKAYLEAEKGDGYLRDRCVFADDINIYDTMSVNVKYSGNVFLSYSLTAHSPYEGWKVSINGTNGRMEAEEYHSGHMKGSSVQKIRYFNRKNEVITYEMCKETGEHGGADKRLRQMLFVGDVPDPLNQMAGVRAGAMSCIIGAAANTSIHTNNPVKVEELLTL